MPAKRPSPQRTPKTRSAPLTSRIARIKSGLPRHRIAHRSGGDAPKNPFFARAGGSWVGGSLPGGRATRGLTALVVGALLLISGRWYFGQRFNLGGEVERVLRAQLIPQLEQQLGAKVEVGHVETDWLGRVVLRDVTIGRDAKLPTGALATARSVTINLDLPGLALRRVAFPAAIRTVALEGPQIYLRRDKRGLNWANMLGKGGKGPKTQWTGRVSVVDGRVYYLDTQARSASGRPLLLDARGVDGTLDAIANAPYRFTALSRQPYFGSQQLLLNAISSRGALENNLKDALIGLDSTNMPLVALADFAFPKRDVLVKKGLASGHVQIVLHEGKVTPKGDLVVRDVAGMLAKVHEPNSNRPLQIEAGNGPVTFAGDAYSTPGAAVRTLGSDFKVAGAVALGNPAPVFDFNIASQALPVARLQQMLPATLRSTSFSSGAAKLSAHISGTTRQMYATGALDAPGARLTDSRRKTSAAFPLLHTVFAASTQGDLLHNAGQLDWRFAARFSSPGGQVATPQGQLGASNFEGTARGIKDGALEVNLDARNFLVQSARYGTSRGPALRVNASTPQLSRPDWRGDLSLNGATTGGLKLAALSPTLARLVQKTGALTVAANFSGVDGTLSTQKIQSEATFALTGLELNQAALPSNSAFPLQTNDLTLRDVRGRLALANGLLNVTRASSVSSFGLIRLDAAVPLLNPNAARLALSLPQLQVSAARIAPFLRAQNVALDGDWRGRVSLLSRAGQSGKFGLDFDLRTDTSTLRGLGNAGARVALSAPHWQGRADFDAAHPGQSWSGVATLVAAEARVRSGTLGRFAALPSTISGARAVGLRLSVVAKAAPMATPGAAKAPLGWLGEVSAERLSAPLPLAGRGNLFATVSAARAHLEPAPGGVDISRFTANYGGGSVEGTARLSNGATNARLLARNVDVAGVQQLLAPASRSSAQLAGTADATLTIAPNQPPQAQLRLTRGTMQLASMAGAAPFPLDGARASLTVLPAGRLLVRDALIWSEGARFAGDAELLPALWTGNLNVSGARLERFAALPAARAIRGLLNPDGLAGGSFAFKVNPRQLSEASVTGSATLKLAALMGAEVETAQAQVTAQSGAKGWKVAITGMKGEAESAPFLGEFTADSTTNSWNASFSTQNLEGRRMARLGALNAFAGAANRNDILARALPINGEMAADVQLTGTLSDASGALAPRPRDGFVRLTSGPLAWRGKEFGSLSADLEVKNGVAHARTLELARPGAPSDATPLVAVSGDLPLDPHAPTLNAQVHVAEATLAVFTGAMVEGRDALQRSGLSSPFFERAVSYVAALPKGTTGRVALDANLEGAWSAPRVRVTNLTLREGRTRVPSGGFSPPAMLDAAFVYEKGALTIDKAEFRLQKSDTPQSATGTTTASGTASTDAGEDEDTLLRVEPGGSAVPDGPIQLSADIFNANLSQLSTWVPALRSATGGPLLRGELTEFSFRVGGTTIDPNIVGSIQAENLAFNANTLDRLRIARFEIGGGQARVEPGNLTVVKGAFQSSSAYGRIPWSWMPVGPVANAPIELHFPLQTRDFGALIGVLVPSLTVADAEEFHGSVDVTGTSEAPQISGSVTIRDGQFRLDPRQDAYKTGITRLSGTVRFVGGNQVIIDADDPLKGRFVTADSVVGRPARRESGPGDPPTRDPVAAGGTDPNADAAIGATKASTKVVATIKATSPVEPKAAPDTAPRLAGDWELQGGVTRELELDTRALRNPVLVLSRLRYDLKFSLDNGAYSSDAFGGVEDVSLGAIWKTGAGLPQEAQNVRWMLAARGKKTKKIKTGGELLSLGSLTLRSDFGAGMESLGRSRANDFGDATDFASMPVAKRINFDQLLDRRAQVVFTNFASSLTGAGSGVLSGRLVLDNRASVQQPPATAVQLQNAALTGRDRRRRSVLGPSFGGDDLDNGPLQSVSEERQGQLGEEPIEIQTDIPPTTPRANELAPGTPLRLGGTLILDHAEIYGAPAGGEGAALLLSRLPGAPVFDARLKLGNDVQIITPSFRAGLEGQMVVSGTPNNPEVLGVLRTRDGQVRFPNARARVTEGIISIALSRDPDTDGLRTRVDIDATARGQAGRYAITLTLRGPLDLGAEATQNLKIDVTSNPPLSQNEAFRQLLGTVPNSEGSTNQAYASSVLSVLSAPLFSGFEQSLAQTLGLTSVGFEYRFNEPLAVQLTKAIGDRVIISYRRSLGSGPTSSTLSNTSSRRTPFELRIDYRLRGDYQLGLQMDERQVPSITLQRTTRF